jgi:hypothetical protein
MSATYTKLKSGTWGIRVLSAAKPSGSIAVRKASGETKMVTIDRVIWSGADKKTGETVHLCSIVAEPPSRGGYSDSRNRAPGGRSCSYCGSRECAKAWNPRDLCDED